jgi:hypothetical protein
MIPPRSIQMQSPYMLQNLQLRPPECIISPQHQSLIESETRKNITHAIVNYWRNRKKQQLLTLASSWYHLPQIPCTNYRLAFFCLRILLFILVQLPLLDVSLACFNHTWPPIIIYQSVSHNTPSNKLSYSQPLTNNEEINSAACMKKVDGNSNKT